LSTQRAMPMLKGRCRRSLRITARLSGSLLRIVLTTSSARCEKSSQWRSIKASRSSSVMLPAGRSLQFRCRYVPHGFGRGSARKSAAV
jgi:hypothetical protein